jgi:hypothetical protein
MSKPVSFDPADYDHNPLGREWKQLDFDGRAMRIAAPNAIPEVFNGREWVRVYDTYRVFHEAYPVTETEFNSLVKHAAGQ